MNNDPKKTNYNVHLNDIRTNISNSIKSFGVRCVCFVCYLFVCVYDALALSVLTMCVLIFFHSLSCVCVFVYFSFFDL